MNHEVEHLIYDLFSLLISVVFAQPTLEWVSTMGGSGNDYVNSVAIGSSDEVYTTTTFTLTADFDPGVRVVNVTSIGSIDFYVHKLSSCVPSAPVPTIGTLPDLIGECSVPAPIAPTPISYGTTYNGTPDLAFPITSQGTTVVTWTYDDGNGNASTQTQNVVIADASAAAYNYQWVDYNNGNAPVVGATSQTFTPTVAGNYTCEIDNGFCTVTTACLTSSVGIVENDFGSGFVVYPNPTVGNLKINLGEVYTEIAVTVYNAIGQVIINESFESTDKINLNLEGAPGMYVLEIKTKEGNTARVNVIKK